MNISFKKKGKIKCSGERKKRMFKKRECAARRSALKKMLKSFFSPGQVAQLVRASSCTQKVVGSIPSQGTYVGGGFDPRFGACRRQPIKKQTNKTKNILQVEGK